MLDLSSSHAPRPTSFGHPPMCIAKTHFIVRQSPLSLYARVSVGCLGRFGFLRSLLPQEEAEEASKPASNLLPSKDPTSLFSSAPPSPMSLQNRSLMEDQNPHPLAISDSYDVEESVASSSLFDAPEEFRSSTANDNDEEQQGQGRTVLLLGNSPDDSNIEEPADTSWVDDALLGVTSPAPPPAAVPPTATAAAPPLLLVSTPSLVSSHPDDEECPRLPHNNNNNHQPLLQPTTPRSDSSTDYYSTPVKHPSKNKIPSSITTTVSHSPDASTVATPVGACSVTASEDQRINSPKAPWSCCGRKWFLPLVAAIAFLLLAGVGTALGILLTQDSRSPTHSSSSTDTTESSNNNGDSSSSSSGNNSGGATPDDATTTATTPTLSPTTAEPSVSPTIAPSASPTPLPDLIRVALQISSMDQLSDLSTPQGQAIAWLRTQSDSMLTGSTNDNDNSTSSSNRTSRRTSTELDVDAQLLQRYALTVLDFALFGTSSSNTTTTRKNATTTEEPSVGYRLEDECDWEGVSCDSNTTGFPGIVTSVNWADRGLTGSIPSEIAALTSLTLLDLGENQIVGSLPEELFQLTHLKFLYLHQNQLTGTLSERFAQLLHLERFYAGNNLLHGPFPTGLTTTPVGANYTRKLGTLPCHTILAIHIIVVEPLPPRFASRNNSFHSPLDDAILFSPPSFLLSVCFSPLRALRCIEFARQQFVRSIAKFDTVETIVVFGFESQSLYRDSPSGMGWFGTVESTADLVFGSQ